MISWHYITHWHNRDSGAYLIGQKLETKAPLLKLKGGCCAALLKYIVRRDLQCPAQTTFTSSLFIRSRLAPGQNGALIHSHR